MTAIITSLFPSEMEGEFMPGNGIPITLMVNLNKEEIMKIRDAVDRISRKQLKSTMIDLSNSSGFDVTSPSLVAMFEKKLNFKHETVYHESILSDNVTFSTCFTVVRNNIANVDVIELRKTKIILTDSGMHVVTYMKDSCYNNVKLVSARRSLPLL